MPLKHSTVAVSSIAIIVILYLLLALLVCSGCETLRFAPGQEQKQIAFDAHLTARRVDSQGAMPSSPDTKRLVSGTRTNLSYIGVPANPVIEDYPATLAKAETDAIKRPDANDVFAVAGKGLSLAAQLAILFGFGGSAVGGKKVLDWIAIARNKSKALEQIVISSQKFLDKAPEDQKKEFKAAQKQTATTKKLVAELKINNS